MLCACSCVRPLICGTCVLVLSGVLVGSLLACVVCEVGSGVALLEDELPPQKPTNRPNR